MAGTTEGLVLNFRGRRGALLSAHADSMPRRSLDSGPLPVGNAIKYRSLAVRYRSLAIERVGEGGSLVRPSMHLSPIAECCASHVARSTAACMVLLPAGWT